MDDLRYWLALHHTPGIGARTFLKLLEHFEQPREIFAALNSKALSEALSAATLKQLKSLEWSKVDHSLEWATAENHHILTIDSPNYPQNLKEIADPPPLLYLIGNPAHLNQPQLAIVGSRNPTPSGIQCAHDFASSLSHLGLTITSGLAMGIDTAAHQGALNAGAHTIAVTGTGLDRVYPARNRVLAHQITNHGVLVSEYPLGTGPHPSNFPRRNRIISGLSLGTLVVEASPGSGSLITARLANEQGREVFAIPGSIHNPLTRGCHQLIRDGAKLVETIQDIIEEIPSIAITQYSAQESNPSPSPTFDENTNLLLKTMGHDPISIDTLIERCGLTAEQISSMLIVLELKNLVASAAGHYYLLPEKAT